MHVIYPIVNDSFVQMNSFYVPREKIIWVFARLRVRIIENLISSSKSGKTKAIKRFFVVGPAKSACGELKCSGCYKVAKIFQMKTQNCLSIICF